MFTFLISLDNRETSTGAEQVGSSTLLDENGKADALNLLVLLASALSLVVIFWSLMFAPSSIFVFLVGGSFLEVGAFLLKPS